MRKRGRNERWKKGKREKRSREYKEGYSKIQGKLGEGDMEVDRKIGRVEEKGREGRYESRSE
jgi:hypothetical protein